jgi:hypothetical protein
MSSRLPELAHFRHAGAARRCPLVGKEQKSTAHGKVTKSHHSTLSNVRVAVMACPVREDVIGAVVIVSFGPLVSK